MESSLIIKWLTISIILGGSSFKRFFYNFQSRWSFLLHLLFFLFMFLGQLTLFTMDIFGAAQKGPPLAKICHTYPTMMKLGTIMPYIKKIQKMYESREIPLTFSPEIRKFFYSKKYRYRLHFNT